MGDIFNEILDKINAKYEDYKRDEEASDVCYGLGIAIKIIEEFKEKKEK